MITDWLHAPDAWMLAPVAAAFVCALVLTLTRRRWDPQEPVWCMRRAILICVAMSAWPLAEHLYMGDFAAGYVFAFQKEFSRGTLQLGACFAGNAILLGWLVPWVIEGRSLAAMGWVRRHAVRYLLGGLVLGAILGSLLYRRGITGGIPDLIPPEHGLDLLPLLPWQFVVSCLALGLTAGWAEENVFRGHLMPAFAERGHSARNANLLQALVFSLYHVPGSMGAAPWRTDDPSSVVGNLVADVCVKFVVGLIFGLMRRRAGSIVPGFAFHSTFDAAHMVFTWGPMMVGIARFGGRE